MNNEIILQNLTEAFEVLKDSWETRGESIANCIVETETYDGEVAMDMWIYVLNKILECNDGIIPLKYIKSFIHDIFDKMQQKHLNEKTNDVEPFCFTTLHSHIIKYKNQIFTLLSIILGKTYKAGIFNGTTPHNFCIIYFVGCLLTEGDKKITNAIIGALENNKNLEEITIGDILRVSNKIIPNGYWADHPNERDYLLSCIDFIKDKTLKADALVTVLTFK